MKLGIDDEVLMGIESVQIQERNLGLPYLSCILDIYSGFINL